MLVERAPGTFDARWGDALREIVGEPGRLVLHAQPIAELNSGSIAGFELLARFQGRWSAPPDLWFAAAEVHGYNAQLQTQVLRTAIAARADLPPNTFLTVNIDPHLLGHPSVVAALTNPGDLSRVVVELTEHSRMGAEAADVLRQVRALGGMVAMDDAGTGYAGLSTMLTLRPQIVKLDRDLISGIDRDPVRQALVEVVGDLAGRMDAWILAEGIETAEELDTVIALGVPLGQGWALARAADSMPAALPADVTDRIRSTAARTSLSGYVASLMRPTSAVTDDPTQVVLNSHGQAAWIRTDADAAPVPATLVAPSTPIADAARRAIARDAAYRFAPLVCTDDTGTVLGLVRIEDLLAALAAAASAEPVDHDRRRFHRWGHSIAGQSRRSSMKTFRCGDVVPGCTRSFAGTDEDILRQVAQHAADDHGLTEIPAELVAQVRAAMVPAGL